MYQKKRARWIALILILVFTHKLGLELWTHHWLHESRVTVTDHHKAALPNGTYLNVHCSCLDDTFLAVASSDIFVLPAPQRTFLGTLNTECSSIPSVPSVFAALRGPPATPVL